MDNIDLTKKNQTFYCNFDTPLDLQDLEINN